MMHRANRALNVDSECETVSWVRVQNAERRKPKNPENIDLRYRKVGEM
jgi:hypothetical protein